MIPARPAAGLRLRPRSAVLSSALIALAVMAGAPRAEAAPTKDECVEAHGRGQDLREEGRLTKARQVFLTCSQQSCPALVQSDCARYSEELGRLVPTVTLAARDTHAGDLSNTTAYIDEVMVATRLDEGKTYDVDPGKHTVRFVHDGKEVTMRVVVNQGEKGRNVIATFIDAGSPESLPSARSSPDAPAGPPQASRPIFPLVVAGAGTVALAAGIVLVVVGLGKVPSSCNNSTKECAAPPGDKAFDDARSGVTMANAGIGVGVVGGLIAVTGVIWYFAQSPTTSRTGSRAAPWVGHGQGGMSFAF